MKLKDQDIKLTEPIVKDLDLAQALKKVYKDLNDLKDSVHNFKGKESEDIAEGKEGDIRVVKSPNSKTYTLQIKGDESWLEDKTAKYVKLKGDTDVQQEQKKKTLPKTVGGLMPSPDWDSGWLGSITTNTTYTYSHNLSLSDVPRLVFYWISGTSTGGYPIYGPYYTFHNSGIMMTLVDGNTIKLETDDARIAGEHGSGVGDPDGAELSSGYVRIFIWK